MYKYTFEITFQFRGHTIVATVDTNYLVLGLPTVETWRGFRAMLDDGYVVTRIRCTRGFDGTFTEDNYLVKGEATKTETEGEGKNEPKPTLELAFERLDMHRTELGSHHTRIHSQFGMIHEQADKIRALEGKIDAAVSALDNEIGTRQREAQVDRNDSTERDAGLGARMDALEQRVQDIRRAHLERMEASDERMNDIEDKLCRLVLRVDKLSIVPTDSTPKAPEPGPQPRAPGEHEMPAAAIVYILNHLLPLGGTYDARTALFQHIANVKGVAFDDASIARIFCRNGKVYWK